MTTTNTSKFTATLVTEQDKNLIVALRNETKLSEKELMTLVIATAIANKGEIVTAAQAIIAKNEAEKAERKKGAYEQLKQKLQQARQAKKADKPAKPAAAPAKPTTKPAAPAKKTSSNQPAMA